MPRSLGAQTATVHKVGRAAAAAAGLPAELIVFVQPNANSGFATDRTLNDYAVAAAADATVGTGVTDPAGGSYKVLTLDGTGDVFTLPGGTPFTLGTGDFTIRFWAYRNAVSGLRHLCDFRPTSGTGIYPTIAYDETILYYSVNGTDRITQASVFSATTWTHIEVSRASGTSRMFVNGTQIGSDYTDANYYICGTSRPTIGGNGNATSSHFSGYITGFQIWKGLALHAAAFTPPTFPLSYTTGL